MLRMSGKFYVLEVQKYIQDTQEASQKNGKFEHIGYMKKLCKTKKEACDYYDAHIRTGLRNLNAQNTYVSDWDPQTLLRYVVRPYNGETLTINAFE